MLVVGFIVAGGLFLQSITFNAGRLVEGFQNLNSISADLRDTRMSINGVSVSARDGIFRIEILNEGQKDIEHICVMIDGAIVHFENRRVFPYETAIIEIPLEKANLHRGSRIKVMTDSFAAYTIYQ
jgi:archaellum component FlaF (FlaF/FlaG flagellin family)